MAALDRLLSRGSDWIAGLWTALAFLTGGWPPVLIVLLAVIVIGRKESYFSIRLILPHARCRVGLDGLDPVGGIDRSLGRGDHLSVDPSRRTGGWG